MKLLAVEQLNKLLMTNRLTVTNETLLGYASNLLQLLDT